MNWSDYEKLHNNEQDMAQYLRDPSQANFTPPPEILKSKPDFLTALEDLFNPKHKSYAEQPLPRVVQQTYGNPSQIPGNSKWLFYEGIKKHQQGDFIAALDFFMKAKELGANSAYPSIDKAISDTEAMIRALRERGIK